jgi:hypothetical protein
VKYIVTYRNPNNTIRTDWIVDEYDYKAPVNKLIADSKKYPGSLQIDSVVQRNAKGEEKYLPF